MLFATLPVAEGASTKEPSPVIIDGRPFFTFLGSHLSMLRDPMGTLTFADVVSPAHSGRFEPVKNAVPSLGFTSDAVWLRFTIKSHATRHETVILELGMSRMRDFDWFVVGEGEEIALSRRPGLRFPTIEIDLHPGGSGTVYMRAQSDTAMWLPLAAGSPVAFAEHAARRDFRDFAQVGFCTALALMAFGLWAGRHSNRLYLGVAVAMAAAVLYFTIFNGLYAWLGGSWSDWMSRQGILIAVLLFSIMFTKFTQDFLGHENMPKAGNVLFAVSYTLLAVMMLLCVVLPYPVALKLAQPLHLLAFAAGTGISVYQAIAMRARSMRLFVLTWIVLLSGTAFFFLQLNGLLPAAPISPYDALLFVFSSVFLLFLLAGANSQRAALRIDAQVAQLQRAETEARLAALRNQLDPHFVFNTLASIEELSYEAPERIPCLIERLAAFLRRRLTPDSSSSEVLLSEEIDALRDYLSIEQVRFEERLVTSFHIESAAGNCAIPELILLPLVENAVKHGFAGATKVDIRISARLSGEILFLRVENNGNLYSHEKPPHGTGTGLDNLRTRLRLRYGNAASFSIQQEGASVAAEVVLPAEGAKQ